MASSDTGYDTSANFCTKYVNFSKMRKKNNVHLYINKIKHHYYNIKHELKLVFSFFKNF
jgi:hypothetical protein